MGRGYTRTERPGGLVSSEDREALADVLHNVDGIECSHRDEQIPCLRDADAILAAGWVSPDQHRQAIEDAREQGAGDTDRLIRDAVRRAEAERDDWKRRHARVQEMYRERFNAGKPDTDWHAQHCAAMAAVVRVRVLLANNPDARSFGRGDLHAALDGAGEQDGGRVMAPTYVCDGCMQHITTHDVATWADHEHVLCRRCDQRKRDGGE
jgi:hypothetical protein